MKFGWITDEEIINYDGTLSMAQPCGGDTRKMSDQYQANQGDDQICSEII